MSQQQAKYTKLVNEPQVHTGVYAPSKSIDHDTPAAAYYPQHILVMGSQHDSGVNTNNANGGVMFSITKAQFALAILTFVVGLVGTVGGFSWALSDKISSSINDARKELQLSINTNRQEVIALINTIDNRNNDRFNRVDSQFDKVDVRFNKIESRIDKIDENFKETNKNINEIKELIVKSK